MMAILGLMGGRQISKYVLIAAAIAAVVFGIWLMIAKYNDAIDEAAAQKAALAQANSETEVANANTEAVAAMLANEQQRTERERRISYHRRLALQQATQTLAGYLTAGDAGAVNQQLCEQAGRIQGAPVAGCGSEVLETGAARTGSNHAPSFVITNATVQAVASAMRQCGDYIESVEGQ